MENHKEKILVVDNEPAIRRILETRLSMLGYDVVTAADGTEALSIFHNEVPNLVVLEVMLPKLDGYAVCQELRKQSDIPIIMLSVFGDVADRIAGLQVGADDYITKPFSPRELESRISSILRRAKKTSTSSISSYGVFRLGTMRIDTNKRQVYKGDEKVQLTDIEFRLLELLVRRTGKPVSRSEILQQVWGYAPEIDADTRVVDIHISHLRAKLKESPSNPELIITSRGRGYLFQHIVQSIASE